MKRQATLILFALVRFNGCSAFLQTQHFKRQPVSSTKEFTSGEKCERSLPPQKDIFDSPNTANYVENHSIDLDENTSEMSRRAAFQNFARASVTAPLLLSFLVGADDAEAFEKTYPTELTELDQGSFVDGRQRKIDGIMENESKRVSGLTLGPAYKPLSSILWGATLWLLSGSRSNPVVTPVANILFKEEEEQWLKDRNDGLFADIPASLYVVLSIIFIIAGFGLDSFLVFLSEGDRNISLQLAGVTLISGASLELGRVASGEKKKTREESDRSNQLEEEFNTFAESRIKKGGNCHRREVVLAFRRYYAKYRQADSTEYPLGDLEIEQLLRAWSRMQPGNIEMSSAGFYSGIQINTDADVFVQR